MFFIPSHVAINFVYGIITPYLPLMLRNLGYRAAVVGILLAISEGAGILGPFLFGHLADRDGKYKSKLVIAYIFTAAAAFPIAVFSNPVISAVLIALLAVGYRSAMPLIDAITTINLGETGNYGKIRVSGSIAFVCFMFFMQWIPVLRPNTPFNIALWICITSVLAIIATIIIPSRLTNLKVPEKDAGIDDGQNATEQRKTIWTPVFIIGLIIIALSRLALTPIYSFLPMFLVEYMRWDAVGLMLAVAALSEIPFVYFSRPLIRKFGSMPILAFASAMVALRLAIFAIFPFKAGIITGQLLHSFCFGLFHPAAVAFITGCIPPKQRSFGMTVYLSLGCGVPLFIGNFLGGFIIDFAGFRSLFGTFTVFGILGTLIYVAFSCYSNSRLKKN
ncbi:MAG: MFS transporter [Treponema sp.]|jgi:PPP family 3-phenylpropionic acid transporter|nr:MFS transporter [Treponema sp.]